MPADFFKEKVKIKQTHARHTQGRKANPATDAPASSSHPLHLSPSPASLSPLALLPRCSLPQRRLRFPAPLSARSLPPVRLSPRAPPSVLPSPVPVSFPSPFSSSCGTQIDGALLLHFILPLLQIGVSIVAICQSRFAHEAAGTPESSSRL